MITTAKNKTKRYIIRKLDKQTGIRHTIIVYGSGGKLSTVTKEDKRPKVFTDS